MPKAGLSETSDELAVDVWSWRAPWRGCGFSGDSMKRVLLGLVGAAALCLGACRRDEAPHNGAVPVLVPSPVAPTAAPVAEAAARQTPIAPIIPTPAQGDNATLCRSFLQQSVADAMPTPAEKQAAATVPRP
jgi:hypothetical protein